MHPWQYILSEKFNCLGYCYINIYPFFEDQWAESTLGTQILSRESYAFTIFAPKIVWEAFYHFILLNIIY